MHELLHFIGICPDSFAHIDLMDIVISNYQSVVHFFNTNIKSYAFKFKSSRRVATDQRSRK